MTTVNKNPLKLASRAAISSPACESGSDNISQLNMEKSNIRPCQQLNRFSLIDEYLLKGSLSLKYDKC
ncbi:hypothetical protein [Endozoicomonas sp. ONNA2]|uniref:hypothetical protein n=1 Tax=Endozoicomonas sp. ONNA2 TaxID=2828741 RepID=UPI0021493091|nr:hypothetical protein [Endozoicomonas sp. ONNA2]